MMRIASALKRPSMRWDAWGVATRFWVRKNYREWRNKAGLSHIGVCDGSEIGWGVREIVFEEDVYRHFGQHIPAGWRRLLKHPKNIPYSFLPKCCGVSTKKANEDEELAEHNTRLELMRFGVCCRYYMLGYTIWMGNRIISYYLVVGRHIRTLT